MNFFLKRLIASYFSYSRRERKGIISILILSGLIFSAGFCTRFFLKPELNLEEDRLNRAWQQAQELSNSSENVMDSLTGDLFTFDPNTLDSMGFIRLGLNSRTTKYLLNWRRKGKHFYKKEDLKPLYSLSNKDYERLAPYIQIAGTVHDQPVPYKALPPLPDGMDLNTIDSLSLLRLDGIGSILAHKIIQRRKAFGTYLYVEQLREVYKFPDTTFRYLQTKLAVYPRTIRKINLNTATEEQLSIHPYIGPEMAKNILLLRGGLNKYEKIEQLRQVPLMNDEKYRKIAPYCTIE